jgi:hypothetical protein
VPSIFASYSESGLEARGADTQPKYPRKKLLDKQF